MHDATSAFAEYVSQHRVAALEKLGLLRTWERGEGAYIFDDRGHRYLDLCGGFAVFSLGRNNPAIREALLAAVSESPANLVQLNGPTRAGQLAARLVSMAPPSIARAFFCNSGTEAVEAALKFARRATNRERMVYCHGAFHGLSTGSLSCNGDSPEFRQGFGSLLPSTAIPLNDREALAVALSAGDVAGFIVEPIQGKSMRTASDEFLVAAQDLCRKHGACFIVDEVQTGLGRTGQMFACESAGIRPDIITLSKALSGGHVPIGVCLHSQAVHESVFSEDAWWVHSSTFSENELAMALGLAVLDELQARDHVARVVRIGALLRESLERLARHHPVLGPVHGRGLMLSLEIRAAFDEVMQHVITPLFQEHRILVQPAPWLKMTPPFVLSKDDIEALSDALAACLDDWARRDGRKSIPADNKQDRP